MSQTNHQQTDHNIVLGMTGASGAVYGIRLLQVLAAAGRDIQFSVSPSGAEVFRQELGLSVNLHELSPAELLNFRPPADWDPDERWQQASADVQSSEMVDSGQVRYFHHQDYLSSMASGSARSGGMVVCPCSGGTLAAIANGTSDNLICRAADVHLKERRKLILVPRETPLSLVHLENMRRCVQAGAVVLPAMPGFYHGAKSVLDLVDFIVGRICDQLDVPHTLINRWGG
ncbi:MAG: UbiX family flavin prenyltransferase [Pirellulales bacterium]|nr:UbiX family flavin prenyltransferase [Pirellulales bacterium]